MCFRSRCKSGGLGSRRRQQHCLCSYHRRFRAARHGRRWSRLVGSEASLESYGVEAGEKISVRATVVNTGTTASELSRLKYYLSQDDTFDSGDKYLNYDKVSALAVGGAATRPRIFEPPIPPMKLVYFIRGGRQSSGYEQVKQ